MRFADSHAHLNHPDFAGDVDAVASALRENETLVLNVAYDLDAAEIAIGLAEKYGNMRASAGVHPHDADKVTDNDLKRLAEIARHDKVAAIGETGLDYFRNLSPKEDQKRILIEHLKIAREVKKPVIIHCRDAFDDILPILKKYADLDTGGVLHCFSEGAAEAKKGVELGFYISFAGNITYKKADRIREAAKVVPASHLLVESDCPWLAPQAMRGKRNEPANIIETVKVLAETRGVSQFANLYLPRGFGDGLLAERLVCEFQAHADTALADELPQGAAAAGGHLHCRLHRPAEPRRGARWHLACGLVQKDI